MEQRPSPESLAGKRVLLTGASGYIGSNLARRLAGLGCGLVRWSRAGLPPLGEGLDVRDVQGGLADPEAWKRALEGVDGVVHLAAQTSTYRAALDPHADFELNARPVLTLLCACRELGLRPAVVLAGTSTACGMPRTSPVGPEHPDNPVTIYDTHKLLAEHYLKFFSAEGIVRGVSLRLTNIYGPGPRSSRPDRGILNMMIVRGLGGEALTVYGQGREIRDYLYIEDTVEAFAVALAGAETLAGGHYVIGSGVGTSICDALELVAERLAAVAGVRPEVIHVAPPNGLSIIEKRNFVADVRAFSEPTGWMPRVDLAQGIDRTIAFFMAREGRSL